jgi:hypothetical protein
MNEDRILNLYEHARLTLFELKAKRLLILRGQSDYNREESLIHAKALTRLIGQREGQIA